jgi:tetratricopeptide (TPR) repeat protein
MSLNSIDARHLIESFGRDFPDAVRLARVVSIATRIEPELLRQARLQLLHPVDAGAEADLWFSPLVESTTPLALTLVPAVADLLRRQLAESRDSLESAWEVLKVVHENAPPAIKLEERVTWHSLVGDAASRDEIEKDLMSVVSAIATQNRSGLARWALRAVPNFPEETRQTKAASTLMLTAAAHLGSWQMLDKQIENKTLREGFINDLRILLPADMPQVLVGVNLLLDSNDTGAGKGDSADHLLIEFSNPPSSELAKVISVPATNPLMLEVSWGQPPQQEIKHLSLYQGRTETLEIHTTDVRIRTAGGDLYTIRQDRQEVEQPQSVALTPALRIPPPPPTGYVSRRYSSGRDMLEQLKLELAPGRTRIAQLWGAGGTGKTVIAAEVARQLLDVFEQRVVWLTAEGRSDFGLSNLLDGISEQLGRRDLRPLNLKAKTAELKSALNSQPALVVIDNFETINEKEQARSASFLKNARCSVLLVSRRRSRHGFGFVVGRLLPDEAQELLERLIEQLPDRRALQEEDQSRVITISGGNPLVMKWLVGQVELAGSLNVGRYDGSVDKDASLRRVFDGSFDLPQLSEDGRVVLLALTLFVPGASRTALAEVAGFGTDMERLNEAARRGLVLRLINSAPQEKLFVDGLVRKFLQERSRKDKRAKALAERFVSYFLSYAQSRQEGSAENYDALESEFENLLDTMDLAEKLRKRSEVIQIYEGISSFLDVRGYWDEALRRNVQAQKAAKTFTRGKVMPRLKATAADIWLRRGELNKAQAAYNSALTTYFEVGDLSAASDILRQLGTIALEKSDLEQATSLYTESLQIARGLKKEKGIADNLHNLAIVAQQQGDLEKAEDLYRQSLEIAVSLDDQRSVAISYHQLGVISAEKGTLKEAVQFFERSLQTKVSLGDRNGMAATLHQLGLVKVRIGDRSDAEDLLQQALDIFVQLASPSAEEVRRDLGELQDLSPSWSRPAGLYSSSRPSRAGRPKSRTRKASSKTMKKAGRPKPAAKPSRSMRPSTSSKGRSKKRVMRGAVSSQAGRRRAARPKGMRSGSRTGRFTK